MRYECAYVTSDGQSISGFLAGERTLSDYKRHCRKLVDAGNHDVKLYELITVKRLVEDFEESE